MKKWIVTGLVCLGLVTTVLSSSFEERQAGYEPGGDPMSTSNIAYEPGGDPMSSSYFAPGFEVLYGTPGPMSVKMAYEEGGGPMSVQVEGEIGHGPMPGPKSSTLVAEYIPGPGPAVSKNESV